MPIAWPATVPDYLIKDGLSETAPQNAIRTNMDAGPPKVRRRGTAAVRPISGRIKMTATQADALDTFYTTTTKYGTLDFEWKHPRTRATVSMHFVGAPAFAPYGTEGNRWIASLALEILP